MDNSKSDKKPQDHSETSHKHACDHDHIHHHHSRNHLHGHSHHLSETDKNIFLAFILNFVFAIIEVVGGIWTNSVAIQVDALHDFGDSLSLLLVWYLNKLSKTPSSKSFSYGLARMRIIGALLIGLVLVIGSIGLLFQSVPHLLNPELVHTKGMIGLSILGIIVNGLAFLRLQFQKSYSERLISLHMLEDLWGWVIVLAGAIVIHFWKIYWLDPILSIALSIYIAINASRNLIGVFQILLQGVVDPELTESIKEIILSESKVKSVHHLHVWALHEEYHIITGHIVLAGNPLLNDIQEFKSIIHKSLAKIGRFETTFEFETENYDCGDSFHKG